MPVAIREPSVTLVDNEAEQWWTKALHNSVGFELQRGIVPTSTYASPDLFNSSILKWSLIDLTSVLSMSDPLLQTIEALAELNLTDQATSTDFLGQLVRLGWMDSRADEPIDDPYAHGLPKHTVRVRGRLGSVRQGAPLVVAEDVVE